MAFSVLKRQAVALACTVALAGPVLAQDLFAPRLYVNDRVITEYEISQRAMFLQLLRAPGNPEDEALKALIEDRLRQTEAERLDLAVSEDEIGKGMEEFASRANLTAEALVGELAKAGLSAETFRDFVAAGVVWREMVRAKYGIFANVSEAEIDRAIEADTRRKALRVLLSASADTGLTGIVLRALRPAGIEPQIVLIDRCETTLQQNRLFAQAADFELETHRGDILDLRCAPADAILSHSFFSFVPRLDRPALARSWAELLVPGGVVLASQRITAPGKEKPFPMRAPDVSDRLARLGASARAAGCSETQAGDICQAGAALWAMHKRGNQSHEDELRGLFADAGIPVEAFDYGAAEPSVSPFPMPKEAVKNPRAEIVCRKSARAG